jgi:hypothetical protein
MALTAGTTGRSIVLLFMYDPIRLSGNILRHSISDEDRQHATYFHAPAAGGTRSAGRPGDHFA